MKILLNHEFVKYNHRMFVKEEKISFIKGEQINFHPKGQYIVPGFIDQHIHGAVGYDVMDNDKKVIQAISENLVQEGTTTFLPTTMTYDLEITKKVIDDISELVGHEEGAKIGGVHLEGPFISQEYIAAQNPLYRIDPNKEILEMLNSSNLIKLVTYAPELDNNMEFMDYLKDNKIIGSVGHSGASCAHVQEAIKHGLSSITHFHNAQSPHHHRNPGVVTAGFLEKSLYVEVIADNIHINKEVLKLIYQVKDKDKISLITDSMRAKSMEDGEYDLGGQKVIKKGSEARLESGILAGSVLRLIDGVKNFQVATSCDLATACEMASLNPARLLNLYKVGELKEGYYFDVTVLDENYDVVQTFVNGKEKYFKN